MKQGTIGSMGKLMISVLVFAGLVNLTAGAQQTGARTRAAQGQNAPPAILIRPARVFDAEDGKTHEGWAVLVKGERIAAVGPAAGIAAPEGARKIDLPGMTLLPGLMDIHSHIFLHPYNETLWNDQVLK
jgi:imidazolonepropionase-like amidohydrolase